MNIETKTILDSKDYAKLLDLANLNKKAIDEIVKKAIRTELLELEVIRVSIKQGKECIKKYSTFIRAITDFISYKQFYTTEEFDRELLKIVNKFKSNSL